MGEIFSAPGWVYHLDDSKAHSGLILALQYSAQ